MAAEFLRPSFKRHKVRFVPFERGNNFLTFLIISRRHRIIIYHFLGGETPYLKKLCSVDLIGLARRGGIKQNRTAHKFFRKKEIRIMKGKKLLAGVLSAAMVLGTVSFSAFADGETTEPVTYTDSESKTVTYQKVTDTDGNITISNETIGSDYAVAEYEINGKSVSFKGTTLRSVNNLMRAYWEVNKTSSGCDYNSAMLPANGTGDLEWKIYGTVTQGEYLNSGALILPSLSGGYIWGSDGGYDWKSITVAAGTNNATIVSSETFNVEHTFVANGKETTEFTGIRFNGGFYAVPHSNMTFDACTFTGRLRTPNGDGEVTVNGCTFTGEANEPEYAFFYQASGKLNFTNNTIVESKYERGLNLDNKDLEATVSGNIIGKVTDQNRSAVQISGIKKIDIERNNITIDGGNVFTLHNNLYTAVAKPEVTIKDNTISGNGYLFYDDAKASGNTFDENELLLVFAGNIIESGIDKKAGKDKTGALVPIESTGYLATRTESVAKIGDKEYTTLKDAMQAACNMNVEDVNGVPTQTAPVTIDLVSDIENQEGFFVRGGDRGGKRNNEYGGHYNHDINIILDGHEHKIDTGKTGSVLDSNSATKIGFASINGKFTVKNVIAPNDLVFDLSRTYNDNVSDCRGDVGQADSLTVENCTFYGSNAAYCGAVDFVTYKNNKFLLTENENDNPDAYPLWYKFNNAIKNFTFEGNTVKSQRALNLARFAENSKIVVNNNSFTIANTENPAKSAAIMLAENHTASSPFRGNVIFSGNTVDAHSAVLVFAPSEYNTSFNLTAESNILANGTKLVGYNEWSGSYADSNAKAAAEALVKKVETNANGGSNVADTLKLTFIKHTDDERVYDIVLNGDGKDINRLNTVHFTFDLDNPNMTYAIKTAKGMSTIYPDNNEYVFYYDGKDGFGDTDRPDTAQNITIGTVTFDGFGVFTFKATAGKATATTTADNLVTEFVTTAEAGKGALKIGEDDNMIKDAEIKVPTQKLTVNVAMEHNVGDNTEAYQDMTVAISGGDLAGTVLEYKLGDAANTAIKKAMNGTMVASYQIKADLTKDRIYTVTVSGAGYRTSRYTVTMTEDKTMNFWNNDKTNEVTVIDDEKAKTTFLAGELVRDGKIDIYDLSAVVAYFGQKTIDKTQASKFAKYDLNRDGEIDIMDISIVLTSWGK